MPRTNPTTVRHVGSVERALTVLEALAESDRDLGTNEISRRTGINPSSVSRILGTLSARGFVGQTAETGRYRLGLRVLQLGNAALARFDLRDAARVYLTRLMTTTGETATLSAPGEDEAMTVDFVQGESSIQSIARVGRPSVAHATAVGKVFLAYGGKLPPGEPPRYTEWTVTGRKEIAEEADLTRRRGWAQAAREREPDLSAIAAPVAGARGELLGIVGLQGPSGRFDAEAMDEALPLLLECAHSLSAEVGGRPPARAGDRVSSDGRSR